MSMSESTVMRDSFGARTTLEVGGRTYRVASLSRLGQRVKKLPYAIRVILENLLRHEDGARVTAEDIEAMLSWRPEVHPTREIAFTPARVLLQDFTGVPAVVDLATMRDAMAARGGDPARVDPALDVDLVIDHSVQVDRFGTSRALAENAAIEYERNRERYELLRWAQSAFHRFRVVPPATGIVHQVNLEYLATVVTTREVGGEVWALPDTLVGTDSHTTMVNGLGVLAWGVGGIEAEAAMLHQPIAMLIPEVVGVRLHGILPAGATATDLVLTVTELLREVGVVGRFVEFFGPGLERLSLEDRATIANMAPEYGATVGYFPVDGKTVEYLARTGREPEQVALVEAYCRAQGLFRTSDAPEPEYNDQVELDLGTVVPSLAGPRRPQDRVPLSRAQEAFQAELPSLRGGASGEGGRKEVGVSIDGGTYPLQDGSVVIAAITSCTNTSNPSVLVAAALLARNAVKRGLRVRPWVKTSFAPGSQVVTAYLEEAGLIPYLEALGFHLVGYGCTTCIGNSGPLPEVISRAIEEGDLVTAAVLSGNRNFEGRVNPWTRANYLASPPLVVAYALAGTMDIDLTTQPIGHDPNGTPVLLADLWPERAEIDALVARHVHPEMFRTRYADVYRGTDAWRAMDTGDQVRFPWSPDSTYVRPAPFFDHVIPHGESPEAPDDIVNARVLALLGDSVTTDHISPAGSFTTDTPAGRYLLSQGVPPERFNTYGSRRGNHEVMVRGTFANIRLRNRLVPDLEGGWTLLLPDGERMTIFDAAMTYRDRGVPLLVVAGKEYGTGSSRDWAAKGTRLLGVRAVLAGSFERIHRSNLVGMGVLPLEFLDGQDADSLGITGFERFDVLGLSRGLEPGRKLTVVVHGDTGEPRTFAVRCRLDSPQEVVNYLHGGILAHALTQLMG